MPKVRQLLLPISILTFSLMMFSLAASPADAAAFIKYDGIDGESVDRDHEGWIDIVSLSWGSVREGRSARRGSGQAPRDGSSGDISVTKYMDKASPKLAQACASGERAGKVEIHLSAGGSDRSDRSDRTTYLTYVLKDVTITSCTPSSSGSGDRPTENITLNYTEIEWTYQEARKGGRSSGNVETEWKVEEGEK